MSDTKPAAKPAAKPATAETLAKRSEAFRAKLAAAVAGTELPPATDGVAWFALYSAIPAVAAAIAAAVAGKYKNPAAVQNMGDMFSNTAAGNAIARDKGANKAGGNPTAHGAVAIAIANACKALQTDKVCRTAVIFYMLTDADALAAFHASKANKDNSKASDMRYFDGSKVPVPAYCNGYLNGNVRQGKAQRH